MVSLIDIETTSRPCIRLDSRWPSWSRQSRSAYPRFSCARVGHRFYDNRVGRWTTQDPIGDPAFSMMFGDPDVGEELLADGLLCAYQFCQNGPVNYVDEVGLSPSAADCAKRCILEVLGIRDLAAAGLVGLGQPILSTRGKFAGATKGTSPASKALSHVFPQKLPFRVRVPTNLLTKGGRKASTKVLGRALGRAVPGIGWAVLGWDAIQFARCMDKCLSKDGCP
jgi:RHS repeat-associated protein